MIVTALRFNIIFQGGIFMKKRLVALGLVLAVVLSMAACGDVKTTPTPTTAEKATDTPTPTTAASQPTSTPTQEPVAEDVKGFDEFMKDYNAGLSIERAAVDSLK